MKGSAHVDGIIMTNVLYVSIHKFCINHFCKIIDAGKDGNHICWGFMLDFGQ
jgi:hypothetical protein